MIYHIVWIIVFISKQYIALDLETEKQRFCTDGTINEATEGRFDYDEMYIFADDKLFSLDFDDAQLTGVIRITEKWSVDTPVTTAFVTNNKTFKEIRVIIKDEHVWTFSDSDESGQKSALKEFNILSSCSTNNGNLRCVASQCFSNGTCNYWLICKGKHSFFCSQHLEEEIRCKKINRTIPAPSNLNERLLKDLSKDISKCHGFAVQSYLDDDGHLDSNQTKVLYITDRDMHFYKGNEKLHEKSIDEMFGCSHTYTDAVVIIAFLTTTGIVAFTALVIAIFRAASSYAKNRKEPAH